MALLSLLWKLYQLKRNEHKTREQILALQEKRCKKLLRYAYEHSPYYRKRWEEAGIRKEQLENLPLSSFPTMNKELLMEHFDEIVTNSKITQAELRRFDEEKKEGQELYRGTYHVVHSSGSTGIPRYFVYDKKAWEQMLLGIIRGALWGLSVPGIFRLLSGGLNILYIAATDGRYGGAMAVGDGIHMTGARQKFLDINTPLSEWVPCMEQYQPELIIGYPSAIKIMAELVKEKGISPQVRRVVSCGEPLSAGLRKYLEQAFSAEVINFYGASESLALGVEGRDADGMVLFDDMNIIEVQDGQMYLTCLYNKTQPLIRYHISDKLVLRDDEDTSPFSRSEILLSRDEDMLWFTDGEGNREFLHPLAVEGLCIEGLSDYQFRQTDRDAFEVLAEVADGKAKERVRGELLGQMRQILQEKKLDYVRFFVRFVPHILPDSRTGKKTLIVAGEEELEDAV